MANLTPEQLAALQLMMRQGGQAEYYDPASGRAFMPNNGSGWTPDGGGGYSGQDGFTPSAATEFRGYDWAPGMYSDNYEMNGTQYDKFNAQGENTGQGTWEGLKKNSAMDTILPFAMAGLPFALSAMGVGAGYGALGATEPVASIGATGGMTQAELAAMGAGGGGAGLGGAGYGIVGGATEPVASIGGGSLLGGASSWLGPAATAIGALAGGQGQKASQTSERKMDPRMDPYVYGGNGQTGLLQYASQMLDKQMAPGYMQGFDDMRSKGQGLLAPPVAGNGFNRFFPGR